MHFHLDYMRSTESSYLGCGEFFFKHTHQLKYEMRELLKTKLKSVYKIKIRYTLPCPFISQYFLHNSRFPLQVFVEISVKTTDISRVQEINTVFRFQRNPENICNNHN